jgi:hypothetical protein
MPMSDAIPAPKLDKPVPEPLADAEAAGAVRKLAILPPPAHTTRERDPRPVTNLGRVFSQFAELQQQIAEQVVALEDKTPSRTRNTTSPLPSLSYPNCATASTGSSPASTSRARRMNRCAIA